MRLLALLLFGATLAGCNSSPSDLRTWRADDHDHTTNPGQDQVSGDAGTSPELARFGLDEVTVIAWTQNCTRCHGQFGRGDGPQGAMFRATDLTNPTWQRSVTDEQVALVIQKGRGQMPPFALPDSTVKSLVRLVRLLDASKIPQEDGAEPAASGAPAPSGAPPASGRPAASGRPVASSRPAASGSAAPRPASSPR
jgi:mono/diheme cytochrome c family protein